MQETGLSINTNYNSNMIKAKGIDIIYSFRDYGLNIFYSFIYLLFCNFFLFTCRYPISNNRSF